MITITVDENSAEKSKYYASQAKDSAEDARNALPLDSISPGEIPDGVGIKSWNAVAPGPYPNCGGIVIPENCFAIIKRSASGGFSFSKTNIELGAYAKKTYVDGLVVGLLDDRGSYNASVNTFPTTGGSGEMYVVKKGDLWYVSVAGVLGGKAVKVGASFRALIDSPGQVFANWAIFDANLGFVPENSGNKSSDIGLDPTSTDKFPTNKGVVEYITANGGKIKTFINQAYLIDSQVNLLGKDWYNTVATVAGEIPGISSKWVDRLSNKNDKAVFDSVIKIDDLGNLNFIDETGNVGASLKSNGTFVIYDLQIVNQISDFKLSKLKLDSLEVAGEINGNTIKENLDYALVITDENGNIGYSFDLGGNKSDDKKRKTGYIADVNHYAVYGQSLSVGAYGSNPITTTTEDSVYTFFKGPVMINYDNDSTRYDSLVLEKEINVESVCGTMGRMLKQQIITDGFAIDGVNNIYDILVSTAGMGGQRISQLAKGTTNYTRFIQGVVAGKSLADASGNSYNLPCVFWLQGEADQGKDKNNYIGSLIELRNDIDTDVKAITGQKNDVIFLNYQMASQNWNALTYPTIAIALNEISITEKNFYSGIPLYPYEHSTDELHLNATSYAKVGALSGYILKKIVVDGLDWKPIQVEDYSFNGNAINVNFNVPKPPLKFDTTLVSNPSNYGFRVFAVDGTEITITSVKITRPTSVKITTNTVLTSGMKLTYGINGTVGKSGPLLGSRGNLRDIQGETLKYKPATLNYPLHNWCQMFEQKL
jgi:hypothetical protein